MNQTRRSLLFVLGLLPFGLRVRTAGGGHSTTPDLVLRFRSFEEAVRAAFGASGGAQAHGSAETGPLFPCRRIEIGHSEEAQAGVQGCHNDRPFAGFPAGHLRIIRTGSEPGRVRQGVRLYVSTVDVTVVGDRPSGIPSRPLDFSKLPAAPTFS